MKKESEYDFSSFKGKMPWNERAQIIKGMFPSTVNLDWYRVFVQDPTITGRVISDIIKLQQAGTGKPGKRPALGRPDAENFYRQFENDDYSLLEFKDAFKVLMGDRSIRHMARKCEISNSMVQRILSGDQVASVDIMTKVAKAFKKKPSYFLDYRILYIIGMLSEQLTNAPEASIVQYNKLMGINEKAVA